ncbi:11384_t:CDS:2 [Funneliformis caledonium]|uniref:11384_t:CDS:1 n=1 Tax=Funneliformis caledonium TaxID=1117310 RepID=A0A9N8VV06_9GLOM|nr:11384_t:CDS:2 [Funneliformis caledonium]
MVSVHRPKERTKSEYQREFTWKNDTPPATPPAPSPAPVAPSPIPQESCNTPEPVKSSSKSNTMNAPTKLEKFSANNAADKWKDGLRNKNSPESRQSTLASSLDHQTKKIVALEANRLSKKSRSYSMYSLHDQLKVAEAASDLSSPYETEYKREFVNWKEYGTAVREDTAANKKSQVVDHTLKRRGSWSAPSLPAPLKWLEGLNLEIGSRDKLQPTVTDAKSIRGITTKITAKSSLQRPSTSAEFRDYHYDDKRPTTSAEYRDYHYDVKRPTTSADYRDNHHDVKRSNTTEYRDAYSNGNRPNTSADLRDYSRPMTSAELHDYHNDDYYGSKRDGNSTSRKESPLRSSTTMGYYDDREQHNSNRRDLDYLDGRNDRKYSDRKREIVYDDRRRENEYDYRRRDDNGYEKEHDSKYNSRPVQTSDQEYYNLDHSRNLSYSSSNKGSVHDEPTGLSGTTPYLEALRHRSSVSSVSSVSTPSSPATPNGYDINDLRWRRSNGLDPRIYKEQYYSPSIASKSSSGYSSKRQSRDYKPQNSALARDGYGRKPQTYSNYSSRPPSRATSVSSHGTSIEEESAILTDMLKEADLMTLRNLTDQMNVFRHRDFDVGGVQKGVPKGVQKGVKNTGRSTPVVNTAKKPSLVAGQKKPATTTTKAGIKTSRTTTTTKPLTRTPTKTGSNPTPGIPPNKKKGHRPTSSLASVSSISSTSSYREAYQDYSRPPPTNFSAAREALNRARMKVEEMLEIVSNGGSLD